MQNAKLPDDYLQVSWFFFLQQPRFTAGRDLAYSIFNLKDNLMKFKHLHNVILS